MTGNVIIALIITSFILLIINDAIYEFFHKEVRIVVACILLMCAAAYIIHTGDSIYFVQIYSYCKVKAPAMTSYGIVQGVLAFYSLTMMFGGILLIFFARARSFRFLTLEEVRHVQKERYRIRGLRIGIPSEGFGYYMSFCQLIPDPLPHEIFYKWQIKLTRGERP